MVELTLTCLLIGDGGVVGIEIDEHKLVAILKNEIARNIQNSITCDAKDLKLYLAKVNGNWLREAEQIARHLKKGGRSQEIDALLSEDNEMLSSYQLRDSAYGFPLSDMEKRSGDIHVLVQLPLRTSKRRKEVHDVTGAYVQQLIKDVDVLALDTISKLTAFLSSSLPVKYPTSIMGLVTAYPDVFEFSEDRSIALSFFPHIFFKQYNFSDTENSNISIWDSVFREPIEQLAACSRVDLKFGRNQVDQSATSKKKKPDFLVWLSNALVFKGEEKASSSDFNIAERELIKKMKLMPLLLFGNMPYLFAYGAAKYYVRFSAIDRSLNISPISLKFDLRNHQDRMACTVISINIFRLLYHYTKLIPEGVLPLYQPRLRHNGTVTLYEDHLFKELYREPYNLDALIGIYDAIRQNKIQCTIRLVMRKGLKFKLEPVGFTKLPASDLELIAALVCVARALVGLHKLGYVHRDVRWPNILCLGIDVFILIDFESAGYDGGSVPETFLEAKALDPLIRQDPQRVYRSCHDMYQFGKLIEDTKSESLIRLRMNLTNRNAGERYTAEEVLKILIDLH
ncbi:hypothetical protein ABG067_000336 [Albugo candida]